MQAAPTRQGNPNFGDASLADSTLLTENSIVAIARPHSSPETDHVDRRNAFETGILPLLGASLRYDSSNSRPVSRIALYDTLPHNQLIVKLFETYRCQAHLFHAITYNLHEIEQIFCAIISRDSIYDSMSPLSPQESQWLALLHVILASGAQFSDLAPKLRFEVSQNYSMQIPNWFPLEM